MAHSEQGNRAVPLLPVWAGNGFADPKRPKAKATATDQVAVAPSNWSSKRPCL